MIARTYILLPALLALTLAAAGPVQAAPITLSFVFSADGLTNFVNIGDFTDNGTGDTYPLANALIVNMPTGYGLSGKVTVSQPTGDIARLTLSSTAITSVTGGVLIITATNPNVSSSYDGPAWMTGTLSGSLINSSMSVQSYVKGAPVYDLDNAGGPEPVTATGGGGAGSTFGQFADTTSLGPLTLNEQITLITEARITFQPGGAASLTDTLTVKSVPEPASLLLISSGVIGLGAAFRRRHRRSETAS